MARLQPRAMIGLVQAGLRRSLITLRQQLDFILFAVRNTVKFGVE